jgi:hypothetical protein
VLTFAWRRKADLWIPGSDNGRRIEALWRTVALVSAVLVAGFYIRFDHCSDWPALLSLALKSLALCLCALLVHMLVTRNAAPRAAVSGPFYIVVVVLYIIWNVTGTFALTGMAKASLFKLEAQLSHRDIRLLRFDPGISKRFIPVDPNVPITTKSKLNVDFNEDPHECENNEVVWRLEPATGAGELRDRTYSAPA